MHLELSPEEIRLLVRLAADQLFRNEFIDPKIPGFRVNPGDLDMGKSIVGRLRLLIEPSVPKRVTLKCGPRR